MSVGLLVVCLQYGLYVFGRLSKWFTFFSFMSVVLLLSCRLLRLLVTVCGLAKCRIFSTKVHYKHNCFFNHKCVIEERHPPFCQTAVRCWRSVCRCSVVHCLQCVGLVALLDFLALVCAVVKNTNVPPNALAMLIQNLYFQFDFLILVAVQKPCSFFY